MVYNWLKYLSFALITMLLVNCGSSQQGPSKAEVEEENKPAWVRNRPVDTAYFIGIAVVSKTANPTSYTTVGQRNALNEMASEIEVRVRSNSMLFTFEETDKFQDEYKEFIQVKANQELENFELVDSWENSSEYWVYYRLSKAQYYADKKAKMDKASSLAIQFIEQGEKAESEGNVDLAIRSYFMAVYPLEPYVGDPLQIMYKGESIYLGNYLFGKISRIAHQFKIEPVQSIHKTVWGRAVEPNDLSFRIVDGKGSPISGVAVAFSYSEGIIRPRDGESSVEGKVYTEIKKVTSQAPIQEVSAVIDFETMLLDGKKADEIMTIIFKKMYTPSAAIEIEVKAPSIYVSSEELNFGKPKRSELVKSFINPALNKGFKESKSSKSADLEVIIETDTRQVGKAYDLFNVSLNGQVVVRDTKTNLVVYREELRDIKGVSTNYDQAAMEAYQKCAEVIRDKIVPRFYRKYLR